MSARQGYGRVAFGCLVVVIACLVFAALAWALVLTGEIPLWAPYVTALDPAPGSSLLPTTSLTITFDQPMDPESAQDAFSLEPAVPGTFRWNQDYTQMTFVPEGPGYEPGTTYTLRLAAGVKAGTLPWTTRRAREGRFFLPPLLDGVMPEAREDGFGPWPFLQATFNYTLDCDATLQTFSVTPAVPGLLGCDGHTLTFSPTQSLEPGTLYVAEMGNVFLEGDGWGRPGVRWELETAPPLSVVGATPLEGASLSDLWTPISITFNRPVLADSVLERFSLASEDALPLSGQVLWQEDGSRFIFQPDQPLMPATRYRFTLTPGVRDDLGFRVGEPLLQSFETEPMLGQVTPRDGARNVLLAEVIRIPFTRAMDKASVETGLAFTPPVAGEAAWEGDTLLFTPEGGLAPETQYQVVLSADVRDATSAPLAEPYRWSFTTQPFLLSVKPSSGAMLAELRQPAQFTFALPMDRASVQAALDVSPETPGELVWSDDDRTVAFQPDPGWLAGTEYEVTLSRAARTADGHQKMGQDYTLTFSTLPAYVQFGEGPNAQVMAADGERFFQLIFRGADVADFRLYPITPTQFLDLYSSGFRGIGPQEPQPVVTLGLTPTVEWREVLTPLGERVFGDWRVAEVHLPADVPPGMYVLAAPPSSEGMEADQVNSQLLVVLTRHTLVLKRALAGSGSRTQAQIVAWDTELSDGAPVVSATVRLYDRDGTFLAEGVTDVDGLLALDVPGDPGPLMALAERDGDWTVCGLSNEWSEGSWWWWWTQPSSRPLYTTYSYTDRPIYRPDQTVYFKDFVRADDDVSYTLPLSDLPITVRLRDARDNVVSTQVLTPTDFGTVHGAFQLADEPMLGTWNLETEVEGTLTRQPLKVEEYRKPEYEVAVHIPQKAYILGETISVTVDANYYFGQPVSGADIVLTVFPTYPDDYYYEEESRFGYPIFTEEGRTDADGRWTVLVPTDDVFSYRDRPRRAMLALEATITDDSGQSVSSYQTVVVQRTSQGLTLLLERHGYQPSEEIAFAAQVRDRDGGPVVGVELAAQVLGWDDREVAGGPATTDDAGQAHFSISLTEQGWYEVRVQGTDDGGREMQAADWLWVYDPTGQAPWYQGQWGKEQVLSLSADRTTYAVGDEAQLVVYTPVPGPALLTFERGETRHAEPITLLSGTNLITVPVRADFAPNIYVAVNQFGTLGADWWFEQSKPEAELHTASTQLLVPMGDRLLTVTLSAEQETYAPGEEATFHVQVADHRSQPVVAEVSLAVVDEAIYALAEDLSKDPFDVFYAPRPNVVGTFDSLKPTRWLFPEGPGLGAGNGDGGAEPRRNFLDTAYWAPTVVTDENGQATITFQLPDNLTEWRALARAVTTDTLVGQATARVVVSQDIVVRPVLPRFLIQGDTITLTAVVHNYTAQAVSATVELDLEGLTLIQEAGSGELGSQVVHVPAARSAMVGWPVRADRPIGQVLPGHAQDMLGTAQVTIRATATYGGAKLAGRDAVELPLPVHLLAVPEVTSFAGDLTPGRPTATMTITLPSDAIEGLSRLEINLAPSVAPGLLQGLEYLIDYPFG